MIPLANLRRSQYPLCGPPHGGLALALLMTRIAAHDVDHAATADNLALVTNPFDAGTDFHGGTPIGTNAPSGRLSNWRQTLEYTAAAAGSARADREDLGRPPNRAIRQKTAAGAKFLEPSRGGANRRYVDNAAASDGEGASVSRTGPSAVIAIVCSKWALGLPSVVDWVHWSR